MDGLLSAYLMGLFGGVHCLGMCGGVVGLLTSGLPQSIVQNPKKVALYHLNYNLGRILSYALLGSVFGFFGALVATNLQMSAFDMTLRFASGVLMVLVGLHIGSWYRVIQHLEKIGAKLWHKIQPISQRFLPITNLRRAFLVGIFWGGMPCGLVYAALSFAMLSGSGMQGGLIMLAFGVGTLPSLLLMAGFSTQLARVIKNRAAQKISGGLIILLGVVALSMPLKALLHLM